MNRALLRTSSPGRPVFPFAFRPAVAGLGARISELHPRFWQIAWRLGHEFKFLLPHDPAFFALRHFIAVSPTGLFLDIGANDGISALSFRKLSRNYQIFSLEPNVLLEPKLRQLKRHDTSFDYRMVGAGSAPRTALFHVPSYHGILLHTFTSADAKQVKEAVRAVFGKSVADRTEIVQVKGEIIRIDDLSLAPSIVKMDAEGCEYEVLVGMQDTIARSRPFIMTEVVWSDKNKVVGLLEAQDYTVRTYDISADTFSANLQGKHRNYFAIPNEKNMLAVC
jgi:FkbM family methyltransferase